MKEVGTTLRKAYYDKITSLTYQGSAVRCVEDIAATDLTPPYVVLSTQTERQLNGKSSFDFEATILIECITYAERAGGKYKAEDLGNLILQNVITDSTASYLNLSPDFKLHTSRLESSNTITEADDSRVYYRKLYRISHLIEQL